MCQYCVRINPSQIWPKLETSINDLTNKIEEEEQKLKSAVSYRDGEQAKHEKLSQDKNSIITSLDVIARDKANLSIKMDVLEQMLSDDKSIPSSVKNILNNNRQERLQQAIV